MIPVVVVLGLSVLGFFVGAWARARPRERLVLVGRAGDTPDAPRVQLVPGGTWVQPLIERAERLHLGPFAVQLSVSGARASGERRVDASLDARVTLQAGSAALQQQGLEALLGKTPQQISAIAGVMLRGKLVVALARHPVPEAPADLDSILAEVFFAAAPLLDTIGLELDRETLVIQVNAQDAPSQPT